MSRGDSITKSCLQKTDYGSLKAAEYAARKRTKEAGTYITAYKCRFCEGWHIGHNSRVKP